MIAQEFTMAAGFDVPQYARPMDKDKVIWLSNMHVSEDMEFLYTVADPEEIYSIMIAAVDKQYAETLKKIAVGKLKKPESPEEVVADQMDALIDIRYYSEDTAARHGMNLDPVMAAVHEANMKKILPDGTCIKNGEKVEKPPGWVAPDITSIAIDQMYNGNGFLQTSSD